ncbi:Cutinase transcription factor 1 alpha [Cytospora mali]|uniref:Cutinase transcription factor 1 alpha n=1 Tax=Cytospora mali TaxID=578113 RepID=A0A194VQ16_CYTMA|nr:Cutinase transcription factor 1 alpha [Valsa mali]
MAEAPLKRSVKFVASDSDGLPVKRRQVQQACDACRKKKKRCSHGSDATELLFLVDSGPDSRHKRPSEGNNQKQHVSGNPAPRTLPPSPASLEPNGHEEHPSANLAVSRPIQLSNSRFVGDLSPESIFIEAANKSARESYLYRSQSDIGTWLPHSVGQSENEQSKIHEPRQNIEYGGPGSSRTDDSPVSLHTLSGHLSSPHGTSNATASANSGARILTVCPPDHDYQHLSNIYLERIHPMLPVLNPADIQDTHRPKTLKHIIFRQVISLAAAVEPSASKHLRVDPKGPLLSFQHFHQLISKAILSSLDANALIDRVDHIRVLLLMFFFYQPVRAFERDLPSLIFSQAVHYAQSLGIHLVGYSDPEKDSRSKDAEGLFCALWALDRLNAAFNGRPCLLHEQDTDRDLDKCISAQEQPAFRLFLKVATMLDRVICIYRPRSKGNETVELPVFESMIMDAGAEKLSPRLHVTLEIFYHAVSVLSCRQPSSAFAPSAPAQAHLPHPNLNARRSLSADRIVDMVSSSLSSPSSPESLDILPFVPYAVSLSLSVSYRKMRYSKVPMYRMRGKVKFKEIVALLKTLGEVYTCARVNTALGEAILREMDKTAKELASSSGVGVAASGTAVSSRQARPASRRKSLAGAVPGRKETGFVGEGDKHPQSITSNTPTPSPSHPGETTLHTPPVSTPQQAGTQQGFQPPPDSHETVASGQLQVDDMGTLLSTPLGDMLDIDLFGHFDPGFNLNAVDAALEANLDMGFPQMWTSQWPE